MAGIGTHRPLQKTQRTLRLLKVGRQTFFVSSQIANPQILGLIPHKSANFLGVPVRKTQIRNYFTVSPQIANPQISSVFQPAHHKFANFSP
jgi:hypothetical protein